MCFSCRCDVCSWDLERLAPAVDPANFPPVKRQMDALLIGADIPLRQTCSGLGPTPSVVRGCGESLLLYLTPQPAAPRSSSAASWMCLKEHLLSSAPVVLV